MSELIKDEILNEDLIIDEDHKSKYKVYNTGLEVVNINETVFHVYSKESGEDIYFELANLTSNQPMKLYETEEPNQILFEYNVSETSSIYLYSFNGSCYILFEDSTSVGYLKDNPTFPLKIELEREDIILQQEGLIKINCIDSENNIIGTYTEALSKKINTGIVEFKLFLENNRTRFLPVGKISYDRYNIFAVYDDFLKEINFYKVMLEVKEEHKNLSVNLENRHDLAITNNITGNSTVVKFTKIGKKKATKLFDESELSHFKGGNIIGFYTINQTNYFVFLRKSGIYIIKSNGKRATRYGSFLKTWATKKNIFIFGVMVHRSYNASQKFEHLYLYNSDNHIAKFKRPFANIRFLKRFGYFKFPVDSLCINDRIHNNFHIGNEKNIIHNLHRRSRDKKAKTLNVVQNNENIHVLRTNLAGNITSTIIPMAPEYTLANRFKINAARVLSFFYKSQRKVNLYFEKKSSKADESGFRVFEKVMSEKDLKSSNYFVINQESEHYPALKEKYGKNVIEKYSFKHYFTVFQADMFISSELSNHLLNDRLYIDSIRSKLMATPLIFLQHGIMFAKPVDNPMAFGFHKDKNAYNIYKNVISSELEAGEFYKMKYDPEDLILTGLATFDYAKLNEDANKIAYMPTYRYWEESLIYNNNIENTSYYKAIIKVIRAFEKAGLLDRLLIVPHNKFSEFIYKNMPEYENIISDNPSEALKQAQIFITDYSSAIYDAQYRGAYPIFYWEERDYLIEQYKAIPALNEETASGPIAWDVNELMKLVQHAIARNYKLEDEYIQKYRMINSFHDGKNTDRIVQFLKDDGII